MYKVVGNLAGNGVIEDVEFDEVFDIANCGGEVLGSDAFAGEEKFRDDATVAKHVMNLQPIAWEGQ